MLFDELVVTYSKLESTRSRLEMTDILAQLLEKATGNEIEKLIYLTQGKIHPDWKGEPEIGIGDKMIQETILRATGLSQKDMEEILTEKGDIGLVAEESFKSKKLGNLGKKSITIDDIYTGLDTIARESGRGSVDRKINRLVNLMVNTSPLGAKYLARIVTGSLRLGIGDMTILDALSKAYTGTTENRPIIERAYNLSSDLGDVAKTLAEKSLDPLKDYHVQVGKPIRMMSAQRLSSAEEVLEKLKGSCAAEYKLDGERFQIHKRGDDVNIFSRRLENITQMYPDAVELTTDHILAENAIIEGEAVAIDPETFEMQPFQVLMQRRRKYNIEEMMKKLPVAVFLFDCLYLDGEDLTRKPYPTRRSKLEGIVEETDRFKLVQTFKTEDVKELDRFFQESITEGTEGLVVKSLSKDSVYRAGARSWLWVKLKRSYQSKMIDPVDLVIVGAQHGRGRRAGSYGALLCASYDPDEDLYKTVCKVGTGFTDKDLEEIPEILSKHRIDQKDRRLKSLVEADVWFEPGIVVEVLGDELTLSPTHTTAYGKIKDDAGLAVRFPRFLRWRRDKGPEEASSEEELLNMYKSQLKTV